MSDHADVVVVGGGIMAVSVAHYLLDAGVRDARVPEQDETFHGTSAAGAEFVAYWATQHSMLGALDALKGTDIKIDYLDVDADSEAKSVTAAQNELTRKLALTSVIFGQCAQRSSGPIPGPGQAGRHSPRRSACRVRRERDRGS